MVVSFYFPLFKLLEYIRWDLYLSMKVNYYLQHCDEFRLEKNIQIYTIIHYKIINIFVYIKLYFIYIENTMIQHIIIHHCSCLNADWNEMIDWSKWKHPRCNELINLIILWLRAYYIMKFIVFILKIIFYAWSIIYCVRFFIFLEIFW